MPTLIGIVFLAASIICLTIRRDYLFPLLIFSGIFQAASVVSFESFGIPPYYLVACCLILDTFVLNLRPESTSRTPRALTAFCVVAALSGFLGPLIFAGTPVYDPTLGIDAGFLNGPEPLHFGIRNLAQVVYLIVNYLVVIAAGRSWKSTAPSHKAYWYSFLFLFTISAAQFLCLHLGLAFPYSMFATNKSYSVVDVSSLGRVIGTTAEPSIAGAMMTAFTSGFLAEFVLLYGPLGRVVMGVLAIIAIASSSSLLAFCVVAFLIFARCPLIRFPWFIRVQRFWRLSALLVLCMSASALLLVPEIRDTLTQQTVGKGESFSFLVRASADLYASQLVITTKGLGVGLGSNRPSSLLTSLASNTGVAGLALFLIAVVLLIRKIEIEYAWIKWATIAMLVCMAMGIPDINFPELWILLALSNQAGARFAAPSEVEFQRSRTSMIR